MQLNNSSISVKILMKQFLFKICNLLLSWDKILNFFFLYFKNVINLLNWDKEKLKSNFYIYKLYSKPLSALQNFRLKYLFKK